MSEAQINFFQIHTICRSDFDFACEPNSIYTVGEDLLKVINTETEQAESHDLSEQAYAIATFPNDSSKIVIGSENGKADIITDLDIDKSLPIMKFSGPVYHLTVSPDGMYVGGCSNEFSIAIYSVTQNKIFKPKPPHESSCLHIGFNSTVKYICSSGCEGVVNIYSIAKMEEQPLDCKIKSQRISKETKLDSLQILRFDWHPTENLIALPGEFSLQFLKENSDGSWSFSIDSGIKHNAEISAVCWNSDGSRILTFCLEKSFKLWDYASKELLQYFDCDQPIYSLKYNMENKVFGFVTHSGYFGVWKDGDNKKSFYEVDEGLKGKNKGKNRKFVEALEDEDEDAAIDRLLEASKNEGKEGEEEKSEGKVEVPDTLDDEIAGSEKAKDEDKPLAKEPEIKEIKMDKLEEEDSRHRSFDHKKKVARHADIIDTSAQSILYPSSTNLTKNRRFLCWNLVGSIIQSEEGQFTAIDIDFVNKNFHSNLRIIDLYKFTMASMNEKGIVLASKADEVQEDEYENELKEEKRKHSHILFRPLNAQTEREKEWVISLPVDENVDTVAIGNNWVAAITDVHFIRFFNFKGLQTKVLCLEKPIVCSAGYENYLAIVYHDSPPFLGCQSMKVRVIDIETFETIYDEACPISPNATMTWFGFSDTGMLITQDSRGIMRGLAGYKQWWPLYFADENKKTSRFWLIGVHEYSFVGVIPEKDELEPSVYQKPPIKTLKMKFPLIEDKETEQETKKFGEIMKKQMILDHEKFRNQKWVHIKISRGKTDNLYPYSETILDKTGILKSEESIEKDMVDMFQDYLVNEEYEKALLLASSLKKAKSLSICIILCNQLNGLPLIDKLNDLLEARKRLDQIEEVQQKGKGGSNEIVILKPSESNPILEKRNKIKKGLSSIAVQLPNHRREADSLHEGNDEIEYGQGKLEASVEDVLNAIAQEESLHKAEKPAQNKENKPSGGNGLSPGKGLLKKDSQEGEKKQSASLFEKFAQKTSDGSHKRKPEQSLVKDELKKLKL